MMYSVLRVGGEGRWGRWRELGGGGGEVGTELTGQVFRYSDIFRSRFYDTNFVFPLV